MIRRVLLSGVALAAMSTFAMAQTSPSMRPAPGLNSSGAMAAPAQQAKDKNAPLFSNYKGADVVGTDGKSIASIADILIDGQGKAHQVVMAFGGVLGIGATLKADQVAELPPLQDGKIKLDLTTASLKALPTWEEPAKQAANNNNNGAMTQGRASTDANPNTSAPGTPVPGSPAPGGGMSSGGMSASSNGTNAGPGKMTAAAPQTGVDANSGNSPATPPVGASPPSTTSAANADNGSNGPNPPAAGAVDQTMASNSMWPVSKIVGADIHSSSGDKTASIDDARFTNGQLTDVVVNDGSAIGLGKGQQTIAFNQIAITGTPAEPQITLKAGGGASPGPATNGSGSTNPSH